MKKIFLVLGVVTIFVSCSSEKVEESKVVVEAPETEMAIDVDYEKQGFTLAMATKGILGKNLMGTISKEGTDKALHQLKELQIDQEILVVKQMQRS